MDIEIQLQAWKDLAISKQVLMDAATSALGLGEECSSAELKGALEQAIRHAKDADNTIAKVRTRTEQQLVEMRRQVDASNKAAAEAQALIQASDEAREKAERKLEAGRADNAVIVKKVRTELNEEKGKIKAISKALGDTPKNTINKLKALKKQKFEDAKTIESKESQLGALRKEKTELKADLETQKILVKQCATLVSQIRELHSLCEQQSKALESSSGDKAGLARIPVLDEELLKAIESAG